jgi:hypothetical protein
VDSWTAGRVERVGGRQPDSRGGWEAWAGLIGRMAMWDWSGRVVGVVRVVGMAGWGIAAISGGMPFAVCAEAVGGDEDIKEVRI